MPEPGRVRQQVYGSGCFWLWVIGASGPRKIEGSTKAWQASWNEHFNLKTWDKKHPKIHHWSYCLFKLVSKYSYYKALQGTPPLQNIILKVNFLGFTLHNFPTAETPQDSRCLEFNSCYTRTHLVHHLPLEGKAQIKKKPAQELCEWVEEILGFKPPQTPLAAQEPGLADVSVARNMCDLSQVQMNCNKRAKAK